MRVLTVVGNRPQFIKAAAVSRHLRSGAQEILVHTGQHYDRELSDLFFSELELPPPDHMLAVGSGSHAHQTARVMEGLEALVDTERPDVMLVYGDTNSTLGAALVAAKAVVPIAHVEAGMRSGDRSMPEEVNRVAADHLSQLLLCPTEVAMANLAHEGLADRAELVGDVQADLVLALGPMLERRSDILARLALERGGYRVATAHRAGNVDDPRRLAALAAVLREAGSDRPLIFPAHPRTRAALEREGLLGALGPGVRLVEPLGYVDFSALVRAASAVLTDSGGLQKEAYLAGVPTVTLRDSTEWTETVRAGWNRLVDLDVDAARAALAGFEGRSGLTPPDPGLYGGGEAAARVAKAIHTRLS